MSMLMGATVFFSLLFSGEFYMGLRVVFLWRNRLKSFSWRVFGQGTHTQKYILPVRSSEGGRFCNDRPLCSDVADALFPVRGETRKWPIRTRGA